MQYNVQNFRSNSGNPVANQFIMRTPRAILFQSYNSIIAKIDRRTNKITLDKYYWDYSRTTGKYRNLFLGEGIAETREKIKSGKYKLKNLNS
jgi:hypothetical protein